MTDKVLMYVFRLVNEQTGLIITKYRNNDKVVDIINDLHGDFILDISEDETGGTLIYLTKLIKLLEGLEDYEYCAKLLKFKNKIKELTNDKDGDNNEN